MSDAKMKNEKDLYVQATLRPTEAERDLPYIASLVSFSNRLVQFLDDLARSVVGPQFHEAAPAVGDMRITLRVTTMTMSQADYSGDSGDDTSTETDGGDTEDDEDASGRQSGALPTSMVGSSTSELQGTRGGSTVTRKDVEGMLLDQHILFEMRLWIVKLEIMQHVTEEFARLRDFISTLVPLSGGISTSAAAPVVNEPNIWDDPHEDEQGSDIRSPHDDDRADEAKKNDL
ncbi:Hypothetical predicted protein [Olea europaea subsp. europaea]|uniref:Uncharacterized protein n=1 Tax=Olea europaea subsp. europaea TaxID=158383 RepID=A0A8S0VMC7_OLEEU|nr:Hypothetical predicted protein [Olea europaea subsp. europaea]